MSAISQSSVPTRRLGMSVSTFEPAGGMPQAVADQRDLRNRLLRNTARFAIGWSSRTWGLLDALLAAGSFLVAHLISPYYHFGHSAYSLAAGAAVFAGFVLFCSCVLGVYDRHNFMFIGRMATQSLVVNAIAIGLTCLAFGWVRYVPIGRFVVAGALITSAGATFACRMIARDLARRVKVRVLFVGSKRKFRPLAAQLRRLYSAFYQRPVFLDCSASGVHGCREALKAALAEHRPDEVVVMDDDAAVNSILRHSTDLLRAGCGVFTYVDYYEELLREVPVESIDARGVLGAGFEVGSFHTGLLKRPVDILLAVFGLLIGAPLMLLCAALVRLTSPGPIIYKQVRVGRYGRPFPIYKFRTMRMDAERNGAIWATKGDSRITPVGKFLRKTRFDELPQLWNILIGDMSLVGPRPERPEFVEQLEQQIPHYHLRHLVQPGLTGWAQVRFRYGASIADAQRKLAFDLYYVRHCGLWFDAVIWLRTLAAMARGAR